MQDGTVTTKSSHGSYLAETNLFVQTMETSIEVTCSYPKVVMKVVWIISASDPTRIQIMRIWRRVFDIHVDVDNPNPIVCGCELGYDVSDIRQIWII
jgi:hypothetical protein